MAESTKVIVRSFSAQDAAFEVRFDLRGAEIINNCIKEVLESWWCITGVKYSFSDITKDWSDDKYVSIFVKSHGKEVQFIFEKPAE